MNGKTAIVTGGSRGIGRAIALELAARGCQVVVNYQKDAAAADAVMEEIERSGGRGLVIRADVSTPEGAQNLITDTVKEFGQVHILVNNAGISHDQLLLRLSDQDWDNMLKVNLSSVFYCSRAVLKNMMKNRYGRMINISSVVGLGGNTGQAHYAASKAGIVGFTRSVAKEYGNRGITANVIAPGYIQTDMTAGLTGDRAEQMAGQIAAGRLGTPADVAALAGFLASPQAAYITGQVIRVDGGMAI